MNSEWESVQMPEDRLMTSDEVAKYLRVPLATIYAWRYRGKGPRADASRQTPPFQAPGHRFVAGAPQLTFRGWGPPGPQHPTISRFLRARSRRGRETHRSATRRLAPRWLDTGQSGSRVLRKSEGSGRVVKAGPDTLRSVFLPVALMPGPAHHGSATDTPWRGTESGSRTANRGSGRS